MAARPFVQVFNAEDGSVSGQVNLPTVFTAPIRPDLVNIIYTHISKNHRQPYGVKRTAGEETSAASWGTGRAVARIPRVHGGGTHRAGQGAFGNMCRGGRMFDPNRVWRRWHRKTSVNQRRHALVSAIAASASAPLVMARGHRVEQIAEVPLVVSDASIVNTQKTRDAAAILKRLNAYADVEKAKNSRQVRCGKGKMRNRRYVQRRGPLVIFNETTTLSQAFRNLPGVELCQVSRLNLLKLAPGGHLGRFCIWTESAFNELEKLYGDYNGAAQLKSGYHLPRAKMANADLQRIIQSDEVQSVVRASKKQTKAPVRRNALKNKHAGAQLNPQRKALARRHARAASKKASKEQIQANRKAQGKAKKANRAVVKAMLTDVSRADQHNFQ